MRWMTLMRPAILAGALFLVACDESNDDQVADLGNFLSDNQIGSGTDYWLVKGSFGVDDRVALIFGYLDDNAACMEMAVILNEKYSAANYTCKPANN